MSSRKRPESSSEKGTGSSTGSSASSNKRGRFGFHPFSRGQGPSEPSDSPSLSLSENARVHEQQPSNTSNVDGHAEQPLQIVSPMEACADPPNNPGVGTSIPGIESTVVGIDVPVAANSSISGPLTTTYARANVSLQQTRGAGGQSATELPSTHAQQDVIVQTPVTMPAKWTELKRRAKPVVTGPVKQLLGPIKEAVDVLTDCLDKCKIAEATKTEYERLNSRLEALSDDLAEYFGEDCSPKMTTSMNRLCQSIHEELEHIRDKQGKSKGARYIAANDDQDAILACYQRVEGYLERLLMNANLSIWKIVHEQAIGSHSDRMSTLVDRLPASMPAWYDSAEGAGLKRRECTPGTRTEVLAELLGWARNRGKGCVYWLNGMAGTGKTTIAYSACTTLDSAHMLGASFFCSRLREQCRDVNRIIPSIAYQLARFSRPFLSALCQSLEKDPDVHGKLIDKQFDALIREPMLSIQHTLPEELVVVIDALDECDDKESTRQILDVLLKKATDLPVRFIVSSRPEPEIRDHMSVRGKSRLVLHELDKGRVQSDIEKYLREGLATMKPSDAQITALVERAGILFIYAATAVRYISYDNFKRNPSARLRTILNGSRGQGTTENREVDQLYMSILEAAFGDEELGETERDDIKQVLHTVVCVREPLTVHSLSELLHIEDDDRVRAALRPLWSALHVAEESELVTTLHASFPDFLFDSTRSKVYHCESNAHHRKLAEHCLQYIAETKPQFNICGLESSYTPDEKVPDIEKRVANAISSQLLYACRHWVDHVNAANCAPSVIEHIRDFLSKRLLLWMEVMNLKSQMKAGMECVKLLNEWCKAFEGEQELAQLARNAKRFVEAFALNPVSRSTPHIYVSMLAFWPKSAPIFKHYEKYTNGPVVAEGPALDERQQALLSTWAIPQSKGLIAVSPDGQHVAVAIGKDVLVVDSSSGKVVLGPFQGPPYKVRAVVFSPDGSRILAGSFSGPTLGSDSEDYNATISGWDTGSGNTVLGPLHLRGHTGWIQSLSFSPDCSRIATSSGGITVHVWNAQTGETLLRLKPQHSVGFALTLLRWEAQGSVKAAVFSPDGRRVAAGFRDTLQVWDSQSGDTILGPVTFSDLRQVDQIALSPDNSRIICASNNNKLIQAGDVQSGNVVFRPIAEHPVDIYCIAFSPDGKHVVSGSEDRAVRMWDIETGNMVLGPLQAHTRAVRSVTFTPDGSRIISACEGNLLCTWDAQHHSLTSNSTNTHSHPIACVKYSSDGTRFVTGSVEGTICIWDADTGRMAIGPVQVHIRPINAIDVRNDRVVSGSNHGEVCVSDARTGEVVSGPFRFGDKRIKSIVYSPDSNLIATGSSAGVNVWNAQDGGRVLGPLTDLRGRVSSIRFSPDGTRIVASSQEFSRNVAVWDVFNGRNVFGALDGHPGYVLSVSYSPDGALIASGSADNTIILWDAHTGKRIFGALTGHSNWVNSVSFSPDSTRLVSGSEDRTIRIWDVQTGQMLFQLAHGHEHWVMSVEYSQDGTRILSRSGDMNVRIHDARSPEERAQLRSESQVTDWAIDKDGWVVDDQSRLLLWVPGDMRKALMWPSTLQVRVPPESDVRLNFDKSRMGESWARSYLSDM